MSEECRYSLVREPLLRVRSPDGPVAGATLAEVLAGLGQGEIASFQALQAHQRQPWFCFLVQLAGIALARGAVEDLPTDPDRWRDLLLALTHGDEAPWCLVVSDVSRPAFMQPPVPEGSLRKAGFKADVETPDQLDMLVTAKNHDLKMQRIGWPCPDHWLYALITLQTMEGYSARRNYGIVRMNQGYGNRPMVGLSPGLSWTRRFRRDVTLLRGARENLIASYGYHPQGIALLWLLPWNGAAASGLSLDRLDPLFIEVCRRIRFVCDHDRLVCLRSTTEAARVAGADTLKGVTGDPWTPVNVPGEKALTVGADGFHYALLQQILLSEEYDRPLALRPTSGEYSGAYLTATAFVRGEGATEGFHHRVVPLSQRAVSWLGDASRRQRLGRLSQDRVELAADTQRRVLRPALLALLSGGKDQAEVGKREKQKLGQAARRWLDRFDAAVDDVFFPELWAALDLPDEEADRRWQELLHREARQQLEDAIAGAPLPSARRYRAVSASESLFRSRSAQLLSAIFPQQQEDPNHEPAGSR